jgi:hypothetical protein
MMGDAPPMVAQRVSRRDAFAAAAGWMSGSAFGVPPEAGAGQEPVAARAGDVPVFPLYRTLADLLRLPVAARPRALAECADGTVAAARAAFAGDLDAYLLAQLAGLAVEEADWAAFADDADLPAQAAGGVARARTLLGSVTRPPVFLVYSHRFDGRTDGRHIFLAVNHLGQSRPHDQVALLAAHEYHHVVRARVASFDTLLDAVVAEGMATACAALTHPWRPLSAYLLCPPGQIDWYTSERMQSLWRCFRAVCHQPNRAHRAAWLDGTTPGPLGAPPRSGYYLGYQIVRSWLDRGWSLDRLTRLPARTIWEGSHHATDG